MTIKTSAQVNLKGQILEASNGEALPGASILLEGTQRGTIADADGKFEIEVEKLPIDLMISYIGFETIKLNVQSEIFLEIKLNESQASLDEVVITALGIRREKKALGYAVQEIDGAKLAEVRPDNLLNGLSGRLAGVQITGGASGVGSSSRIVIRGEASLSGNNEALFVVDGVPISNETIANDTENDATGFQEVDYGNGAADINPDDIESVSILRGAGATALYGSRGANGVVVIKTKSGKNTKGIGVSINSSVTLESALTLPQYQNLYGQGTAGEFAYEDGNGAGIHDGGIRSFGPKLEGQLIPQFDNPSTDINGNPVRAGDVIARNGNAITATPFIANPNNVENFFETGSTFINNVALSGANDFGHFRLSYTNFDNQGIVPNTDLKRNSVAFSGGYQLNDKLSVRSYVNYISSGSTNRPATGYGSENPLYLFTWMGRQVDVEQLKNYWQAGQEGIQQFNYNYTWMDNPYFAMFENTNGFNKDRIIGNLSFSYDLLKNLSFTFRTGIDNYNDLRASRRAFSTQRFRNGAYREDEVSFREINTDFLLRYNNTINDNWSYTLSAGGNRMDQELNYGSLMATELSVPGVYNFENSRNPLVVSQFNQKKRVNSLYALGQIAYKSGLFLDLSLRNDWSSTLPPGNNSYAYYAASLSTVLSEMMELPEAISFAKLRLSYGVVGNDTNPFNYTNTFEFGQPYGANPTVTNSNILRSTDFEPEFVYSFETGADVRFGLNRFGIDVTYYRNISTNQIVELPVSVPSGVQSRIVNGGRILNQGVELMLNFRPIVNRDFTWDTNLSFTRNISTVQDLPDEIDQYVTGFSRVYGRSDRSVFFIAQEGGRLGDMYGTGFLTENGQHVYDENGNPVKDPNLRLLGNYNPDFILGLDNNIRFKNFELGFLFDLRYGGTIVSRTLAIASTSGVLENTLVGREEGVIGEGVVNVGTEISPEWVPNTTAISAESYYNQFFDRDNEANMLYDASYLKLRQVRIGYRLPDKLLTGIGFSDLRISLIARNVALWTENPHFDPELNALQGRNFAYGVEDMSYPSSRSVGLSLSVKL